MTSSPLAKLVGVLRGTRALGCVVRSAPLPSHARLDARSTLRDRRESGENLVIDRYDRANPHLCRENRT